MVMAFASCLTEWKKFVKSDSNEESESNLSSSSCLAGKSSCGSDVRKVYEGIIGNELNLPGDRTVCGGEAPGVESELDDTEAIALEPPRIEPVKHCSSVSPPPTLSALMSYIECNEYNKVMEAIIQDANLVNAVDQFGWSLLMVAACAGAVKIVELLLQSGADVALRDKSGHTCVSLARKKGHLHVVKLIKKFCPADSLVNQSNSLEKKATSQLKFEVCSTCNLSIDQSQKKNHLTSTVHQLSQCVKGCRTYYSIGGNNRGYQLMLKNGWDGEKGLGPSGSGVKLPPKTILKRDRKGLGASKGTARITHFHSNDHKAVARNPSENVKRHQNKSHLKKQIQRERLLEVALRRELS